MLVYILQLIQHMMAQLTPLIVLVAVLLINALYRCSAESVYCLTPTAISCSSCPHNSTHCTTLSEYAQEAKLYFTSNTTIVFLPGNHVLDTNITVAYKTSLIMHAWRIFLGKHSNNCLQWTSWPQLHKHGGLQNTIFSFYLLQ